MRCGEQAYRRWQRQAEAAMDTARRFWERDGVSDLYVSIGGRPATAAPAPSAGLGAAAAATGQAGGCGAPAASAGFAAATAGEICGYGRCCRLRPREAAAARARGRKERAGPALYQKAGARAPSVR